MKPENSNLIGQERHLFLMVKSIDQTNPNIVHATVSTDEIDRYEEIVLPSAIINALPSFLANPVVLPAHQHRLENGEPPVIGRVITESIKIAEHQVDVDIEFDNDSLGQKYADKYRKGFMRAFSIGFRGLEGKYEQLAEAAKNTIKKIWTWTSIELLEISAVAVPANRGALARAKGYYEPDEVQEIVHQTLKEHFSALEKNIEQKFDEIKSLLIADPDGLAKHLLDDAEALTESCGENDVEQTDIAEKIIQTLSSMKEN
ncbi:MAG: HK97 family phage prohead protease [Phycisphaerae bacterium]